MGKGFSSRVVLYPVWLLSLSGLVSLGLWQLDRAEQKEQWRAQQSQAALSEPTALEMDKALEHVRWARIEADVEWVDRDPLYLDNRTFRGRAGYEVLLPARLPGGDVIMINLGWIEAPRHRDLKPEFAWPDPGRVSGVVGEPVETYVLETSNRDKVWRLQSLDLESAETRWQLPLLPWVLWLDRTVVPGIEARVPGRDQMPPERHLGYAVQWFALALTLLLLGGVLEWKTRKTQRRNG